MTDHVVDSGEDNTLSYDANDIYIYIHRYSISCRMNVNSRKLVFVHRKEGGWPQKPCLEARNQVSSEVWAKR